MHQTSSTAIADALSSIESSSSATAKLARAQADLHATHLDETASLATRLEQQSGSISADAMEQLGAAARPYQSVGATPARKMYNFNRTFAVAPQPIRSSRSSVLSNVGNLSTSSAVLAATAAAAAHIPRQSEIGRLLSQVSGFVSGLQAGGNSSSPSPSPKPPSRPLQIENEGEGGGGALQDLSKRINLPRGSIDASEDDEEDAVDTSLGSIKRPLADDVADVTVTKRSGSKRVRAS